MRSVRVLSILVVGFLVCAPSSAWAQGLGTLRWRTAPFCSVLTVTVTASDLAAVALGLRAVALGDGAFSFAVSDANLKEHFRDLDGDEVLSKIARMPIREWSYKAQDPAIRHIGPTAQDFHAAFGLGEDPLRISTIDADGVALRAIQALEARTRAEHGRMLEDTQSLADESGSLVQENAERKAEIARLKAELMALRAEMAALKEARR